MESAKALGAQPVEIALSGSISNFVNKFKIYLDHSETVSYFCIIMLDKFIIFRVTLKKLF